MHCNPVWRGEARQLKSIPLQSARRGESPALHISRPPAMPNGRGTAARQLVENYVEPYLGMPLIDAKAVKSVQSAGKTVRVDLELGFPLGGYRDELVAVLEGRLN